MTLYIERERERLLRKCVRKITLNKDGWVRDVCKECERERERAYVCVRERDASSERETEREVEKSERGRKKFLH